MEYFYSAEQKMLRDMVRRFAEETILPAAAGIDSDDLFPRAIYRGLADLGLFGVSLPEAAGGSGQDTVTACIAMEEIARCSGAVGSFSSRHPNARAIAARANRRRPFIVRPPS